MEGMSCGWTVESGAFWVGGSGKQEDLVVYLPSTQSGLVWCGHTQIICEIIWQGNNISLVSPLSPPLTPTPYPLLKAFACLSSVL